MSQFAIEKNAKNDKLINLISLVIPIAVALLIGIQTKLPLGAWTKILPHVIGLINSTTALSLIIGLIAYVGHNFLSTQIDKTANKMETASADFLDILQEPTQA